MARITLLVAFLLGAACLEVWGDSTINHGMETRPWRWGLIAIGGLMLAAYGFVVNRAPQFDPSLTLGKLLGVYVAVFAVVGSFWRVRSFADLMQIPIVRYLGIGIIVVGGILVQLAP
jgi:hypothetical protein